MKKPDLLQVVTILAIVIVAVPLLFPAISCGPIERGKTEAKTCVVGISAALKAYFTEYGKWPDYTGDGLFLDEARNAQLMRTLRAQDETNNPRKIVFFEGKTATKRRGSGAHYGGGFHPETGAFLDPQGNPYRIAIDSDNDGQVENPYSDGPHSGNPHDTDILTSVIARSLGKDGKQGSPANPHTYKGSDDVTSWQ
jgi:hypothetical protein